MKLVIGEEELNKLIQLGRTSFSDWMDAYEKLQKENEELKSKIFTLENKGLLPAVDGELITSNETEREALERRWANLRIGELDG